MRPKPEPGAAEESHPVLGAPIILDEETQKGGGSDEELEQLPPLEELTCGAAQGLQPQDRQRRFQRNTFTSLQLQELETVFHRTQYPDVFARKELAICMGVPEAKAEVDEPEENDVKELY
ncbi:rhox homeobox family member 1 [Nycticebus coucang]|uniref:rhox homeobox family member 1 n=1 Tax=Nycticebus coucang TaxID=9470 RepID=UPI00234E0939|nr:rhox homeobox family member 1 [Nycticebus coucang]